MPPNNQPNNDVPPNRQGYRRELPGDRARDQDGDVNGGRREILLPDYIRHFFICVIFLGAQLHRSRRQDYDDRALSAVQKFYTSVFNRAFPVDRAPTYRALQEYFYTACFKAGLILYADSNFEHSKQILREVTYSAMIISSTFHNYFNLLYPDFPNP